MSNDPYDYLEEMEKRISGMHNGSESEENEQPSSAIRFVALLITLFFFAATLPLIAHLLYIVGEWSWNLV